MTISGQSVWSMPNQGTPMDESETPEFQALYGKARAASNDGNLKEAVRLYKAAYELRPDPVLLYNIARILHKLTRFQEARIYYQMYIDSPIESDEQKKKAQEYLDALKDAPNGKVNNQRTPLGNNRTGAQSDSARTSSSPTVADPLPSSAVVPGERPQLTPADVSVSPAQTKAVGSAKNTANAEANTAPLYRKWWFWTIVGGVAAAGAVGLGVGLSGGASGIQSPADAFQYTPSF